MYFWVPVSYRLINIFKKVNRDDASCFSEEAYKIAWIDTLTSRYCKSRSLYKVLASINSSIYLCLKI